MRFSTVLVAQYALFVVVAVAGIVCWRLDARERLTMVVAFILAAVIGAGLLFASAHAWSDPRPFVVDGVAPLIPHVSDNGFPSDHSLAAALVAGVVLAFRRRVGLVLLGVAFLVGAARVAAHLHHFPDVLGGLLIGLASAILGVVLARAAMGRSSTVGASKSASPRSSRP